MELRFSIIIVTHNSQGVLQTCVRSIENQSRTVHQLVIVDSGSQSTNYLEPFIEQDWITVHKTSNIGFSKGNNVGLKHVNSNTDIVCFINPDTFLDHNFIQKAEVLFRENNEISILSGKLLAFDLKHQKPNGLIDSCGIFRKWYGRWYDRGQGEVDIGQYSQLQQVPALCGACICLRKSIIDDFSGILFDPDFFLYKEDVELSLRLGRLGIALYYVPDLRAYHCRGWSKSRKQINLKTRKLAAANEILLYKKHPSPYIFWAILKYILVTVFKV